MITNNFEHKRHAYIVSPPDQGMRLDLFLSKQHPELTRSFLKRLIDRRCVLLNGKPAKPGAKLKRGDAIELRVPPPEPMAAEPEAIPIDVVHEDEAIIVVNKPPNMVVHPAAGNYRGTLVNALLHHYGSLSGQGGLLRPGIVHRLDKNTSGLLVVAKNDYAHNHLAEQFKNHSITRKYQAIVIGLLKEDHGTITSLIGRHPTDRKRMSSRPRRGKEAVTHWKVLQWSQFLTHVEVTLETGRTHQIRVHLASIHHPVLGDPDYGGRKPLGSISPMQFRQYLSLMKRQALHAHALGFVHPVRKKYVEFRVDPADDFQRILDEIREND